MVNSHALEGGAARAAYRLQKGLRAIGLDARTYVQHTTIRDPFIIGPGTDLAKVFSIFRPYIDQFPVKVYGKQALSSQFSPAWLCKGINTASVNESSDIVHLHWITNGFVKIEDLSRINRPIVWTLHDMWAFTGGCHYSGSCEKYCNQCGRCPELHSDNPKDLAFKVWKRKLSAWKNLDITVVAPSKWLGNCASKSTLFNDKRIETIPNGIDINIYKPINRLVARDILNLPLDKTLILFSARDTADQRKGFATLNRSLTFLITILDKTGSPDLVVLGAPSRQDLNHSFAIHQLGIMTDDISMSLVYAAADVFIAPSNQDNLPNTILEALACGTPCVAFDIGGFPDMVEHKKNGYLADPYSCEDLANGLKWVISDKSRHASLCKHARNTIIESFDLKDVARRYAQLYSQLAH